MITKFLNLDKDKQERILNAAMKEFAQKGYDGASTNEIVKEAGIAKGLLFHYFKNKKQLFLFLHNYCIELLENEIYQKINLTEVDIIKKLHQISVTKLGLLNKFPQIIKFIQSAHMESSPHIRDDIKKRNSETIKSGYAKIFEGIDVSLFKEGIDVKRAINIIIWTFDGFSNSHIERMRQMGLKELNSDEVFAEGEIYLEIFKKSFYK